MRPKKVIVLIDENEDRRGEFAFVLRCWGYRVLYKPKGLADLVIAVHPLPKPHPLKQIKEQCDCSALWIGPAPTHHANTWVPARMSRMELLERIHIMSARKRGPKPMKKLEAA